MALKPNLMVARLAVLMVAAGVTMLAFAREPSGKNEVINIVLDEWQISSDAGRVKAGPVTFRVNNRGEEPHELVIVKTDLPIDMLPTREGRVIEDKAGEVVGEIDEFSPNITQEAIFNLSPGHYALICNMVEQEHGKTESHYIEGMRIALNAE